MTGWIKLHRQIKENWIWQDPEKLRAWIDILLRAGHEETKLLSKGELLNLKAGQFVTGIQVLADSWGWSKCRVYRFLSLLEKDGMITKNGTHNGTVITVVNWALYQIQGNVNDTPNDTPFDTPNDTPGESLSRMYKNIKKGENSAPPETEEEEIERELRRMRAKYGNDA